MTDQSQTPGTEQARPAALWSIDDLAAFLGVPVGTIYQWRTKGYGPVGVRVGRFVRFRPADVHAWVDALAEEIA
ncbi:MAG TPA: helix-turn-helix domain-containing protein [Intrasporangium sp.]|nr:helix-turn-helix domain-containing protein [Intrasporangium sp.]